MIEELWSWFRPVVPWLLAIAGWIYASKKADRRETRKELRSDLSDISNLVESINAKVREHHKFAIGSVDAALSRVAITTQLQSLIAKIERIIESIKQQKFGMECNNCTLRLEAYFDLSSGDHLETDKALTPQESEERYLGMYTAGILLEESLHRLFRCLYPHS